ncbi:vacuolar protein sorting-associated protein 72 homolog [Homalodisca vitripennis]|uniref:vacuolar protein sorting-associated protein 72 homolog n=1 Tax=Homalodisca vitripennis TaxID=197043 RepID=UPI001EEABEFC|nr:vacuolar protein sorting-associated protein 72 homolog [Homalodisca vitripennis]XP_046675264.1 vacuolar protein sorting-associated protein 72 homolog [Homalodisca vitripennis]
MAANREKRSNAGNKLAKLLNEEEEDDFYKTTYGGFEEVENDDDYQSEEEAEDEVDSDFSIEENDEVKSDDDEEATKKRQKKGLYTKAYKEPKIVVKKLDSVSKPDKEPPRKKRKVAQDGDAFLNDLTERKSTRHSTAVKSAETAQRVRERALERRKNRRSAGEPAYKPTQEELLEEAKLTEQENLRSLEKYQKLELERKKCRTVKKVYTGPTIRYHSISMPLLGDDGQTVEGRYERTFITFSDADTMVSAFPSNDPPKPPSKNFCPITRVPAKYLDPVTHLPYCNIATFRVLREAYYQQLEARGDRGSAEIAAWLAHRQTSKTAQTIKMDPSMLQITKFKEEPDKNVPCESSACLPVLTSLPTIPLARIPLPEDIVSITSPTKPMKM